MPNPITQLVNRFGPKPLMITTGSVSLGIIAFSTASLGVGVLTLLSMGNVLPGALTSLQSLGLAGGIAFTAVGSTGVAASSGFLILVAVCTHSALRKIRLHVAVLQEPMSIENEDEIDENIFFAYQQIVNELKDARCYQPRLKDFCFIKFYDYGRIFLAPNYVEAGPDLHIGVGSQHRLIIQNLKLGAFIQGLILHLNMAYPDIEITLTHQHNALILKLNKEEEKD